MADEFYDFDKALHELHMEEEELKRLVSAGEIRAFRSKGQMKFRKQDIEKLRSGGRRSTAEPEETLTDELVFDEAEPAALEDEEGMATAKIDEQDTLIDEELPGLESDLSDLEQAPVGPTPSKRGPAVVRRTTRVTRMLEAKEARKAASPVFFAILVITTLLMLYGVAMLSNIATNNNTGMTKGISEFMVESFASGSE